MGSYFFATGRFQLPNWNSQIPPVCKKFFIQWKEQGVAGVVGRGRVVALDHKDVWKTWFWGLGCLMGIKEWRLEDANRWCGVAVPRLPDASLCSCHISTGLKARGYSFSRLPDELAFTDSSLTCKYNYLSFPNPCVQFVRILFSRYWLHTYN